MERLTFLLVIFVLASLVLTLHLFALNYFLYWRFWWFDIPLHFLGGATVGLFALVPFLFPPVEDKSILAIAVLSALVFSLMWEWFEFTIGFTYPSSRFFTDTVTDVSMGLIGGFSAAWLTKTFIRSKQIHG